MRQNKLENKQKIIIVLGVLKVAWSDFIYDIYTLINYGFV